MRVRFENHGNLLIVKSRQFHIDIPRGAGAMAYEVDLPDTEEVRGVLSALSERHKTLFVTYPDEERGGVEVEEEIAPAVTLETFKGRVKEVIRGRAGWWTVHTEGCEPLKLRGATTEEEAIELAHSEHLLDLEE